MGRCSHVPEASDMWVGRNNKCTSWAVKLCNKEKKIKRNSKSSYYSSSKGRQKR